MAQRGKVIMALQQYAPIDDQDRLCRDRLLAFVEKNPDCFERSKQEGHVTASAWVVDKTGGKVLLTHHKKLRRWLQLGGHADGDPNILQVALREAQEESGIRNLAAVTPNIFDVDIHLIDATATDPAHTHFDIRFVLRTTDSETYAVGAESYDLAWVSLDHLETVTIEPSMLRMKKKWLQMRPNFI